MPFVLRVLRAWCLPGVFRSGTNCIVDCHWWQDPLAHPALEDMTPSELGDLYFDPAVIEEGAGRKTGHGFPVAEEEPMRLGSPAPEPSRSA